MPETPEKPVERYSFSKLSAWWQCPYAFYQRYILGKQGIGNAFSSYGTLVHSILERYAKGELELWNLSSVFEWEFDNAIPYKFPRNKYTDLRESYYSQGVNFLSHFHGYESCEVLGVEQDFEIPIDDWKMIGFIDLIFIDERGRLVIRDYKSKAAFKNADEQHKYARQMYIYSLYIKEKYGRFPDVLQFLMFRKQKTVEIKFSEPDFDESIEWAKNTVRVIRDALSYPPVSKDCDDFFSQNLCNHREYCEYHTSWGESDE